jgi:zinc D-Ala-D-Ala dipeptidase
VDQIVLMADARVAAVPIVDCGENLVDVAADHQLLVDDRNADPDGAFTLLRRGVYDRLLKAQAQLPDGLRLLFAEGYRPPALQSRYFTGHAARLAAAHPEWTSEQVHVAASQFVSPPDIAPHSAGAAVDLTLATADGTELDMGCPIDASPEESDGLCYTHAAGITEQARANRAVLVDALTSAGLINYPTEWWHWSFGDRYWALLTGSPNAIYGPHEPSPSPS